MNISNFKFSSKTKYSTVISYFVAAHVYRHKKKLKCHEEAPETELPISHIDTDDPEFQQLQQILSDPNIDREMYEQILNESHNIGIQPMKFNLLHNQIKNDLEEDNWSGLRVNLNWRPTTLFNSENQFILDDKNKGLNRYRISATTIIPGNYTAYDLI